MKQAVGDRLGVALIQRHHEVVRDVLRRFEQAGANALIGVHYDATEIGPGVAEVLAYVYQLKGKKLPVPPRAA